jgi:hypothetical protein
MSRSSSLSDSLAATAKEKKAEQKKPTDRDSKSKEKREEKNKGGKRRLIIAIVAFLIIAVIAFVFLTYFNSGLLLSVPFSTFKDNFNSAHHVAVIGTYANQTQYAYVAQCAVQLIQTIVHSRNVSFYLINQTSCTYQEGSLGKISIKNDTPSNCLLSTKSYPTVFLNYSEMDHQLITLENIYIYGDKTYMSQCPIAVDLS